MEMLNSFSMKVKKWLKFIVVFSMFIFFYSCLTIEQELWLKEDGSGFTIIKYKMPANLFADKETQKRLSYQIPVTPEKIQEKFSNMKGITVKKIDEYLTRDKMKVIEADLTFDNIKNLNDGTLDYYINEDKNNKVLKIVLRRKVHRGNTNVNKRINVEEIVKKNLKKYQFRLTIHLPSEIVDTENLEKKGERDAFWTVPFNVIYEGGKPLVASIKFRGEPSLWEKFLNFFRFLTF